MMDMAMADEVVGIVGAGIVGLAIGREITRRRPGTRVVVLEKEEAVAQHQTGHNSGVVHAGLYYQPGSLKARLCTRGAAMIREYVAEKRLPYEECGKLVVAIDDEDAVRLAAIEARADRNAVPGLRRLDAAGIREIEPHATGIAALHSPRTAITDYTAIARAFADDITAAGGEVRLRSPVTRVNRIGATDRLEVVAGQQNLRVDKLILCAGLQSDVVARLVGDTPSPRIIPFRGEYMLLRPEKAKLIRGLIYPVPDPRYPFLGVHYTKRVNGDVDLGPNAVLATAREGYGWGNWSARDLASIATWPGMWRMAARHWRTGIRELHGSLSKKAYLRFAQLYVPEIGPRDVVKAGAGVRAQALDRDGGLVDDFRIHRLGPVTAVRNAPSPAATSSMAIAEYVVDTIEGRPTG
jgi:L-2-hydroxyglutarate oxidase